MKTTDKLKLERAIKALKTAERLIAEVEKSDKKFNTVFLNMLQVNYKLNWVILTLDSEFNNL